MEKVDVSGAGLINKVLDQLEVSTSRTTASDESDEKMMLMTISLAKERLKARRMKMSSSGASRKKTTMDGGPAGIPKEDESDDLLVSGEFSMSLSSFLPSRFLVHISRGAGHLFFFFFFYLLKRRRRRKNVWIIELQLFFFKYALKPFHLKEARERVLMLDENFCI